ncbi:MAG TPA: PAS domain S-box protein, partial [Tenuifilaceae bacterium]|nr:PAS domain S-box protein [Tenuifilaceae bacterium]
GMAETTIYKSWITFNTKLCQILGYKPDELEKLTWDKITHPDDVEFEVKQFNNILQRKNDSYTLEKRFIKKDGSIVYCNVAVKAIKDNTGAITHLVKLIEDITLRKKAETALLESQNRLKKAQEIAHLGVCRLNALTGYLDVSEQALEILEWNKENAPFKLERFIQTIHPTDRDIVNASIDRLRSLASEEENLETRIIRSSGEIAYLSLDLGVAIDTNRKITDLIITFADITSSKLAEEALKDPNAMKDQLFSVISHDLRGPIGSVEQMLSLYLSSWESMDNESRTEIITLVHNTTKESYNLLENLLEWGRSQRQATIKPIQIEIQGVVSETVQLLSSMASAKNINIGTNISNECKAFVDPMMFKTIIRNLISNAIKFTPNGGRIDLNCSCNHQLCTIQVSDTGVGIPVDRIELIFDDSKVFSTSGTNSEKGTGLGLKLVKRFVDKNGGTIKVSNNQDQGTTFTISLPAQESN